jgi:hypothetical protein
LDFTGLLDLGVLALVSVSFWQHLEHSLQSVLESPPQHLLPSSSSWHSWHHQTVTVAMGLLPIVVVDFDFYSFIFPQLDNQIAVFGFGEFDQCI